MPKMSYRSKKSCTYPLCNKLIETGSTYCNKHKKKVNIEYKDSRTDIEEHAFYKSYRWQKLRKYKLNINPVCEDCLKESIVKEVRMVDHIKPIKDGGELMAMGNLQSLYIMP